MDITDAQEPDRRSTRTAIASSPRRWPAPPTKSSTRVRRPGKWTAREVVHHLADSEMTSAIRLRLLLAVDKPVILGYDQEEFARRLHYDRPIEASLDAFKAARRTTGEILDCMTDADWAP